MAASLQNANAILRRKQVQARVGISRSGIYAMMKSGLFPQSIKISARSVGWLEHEITAWLETRVNLSRPQRGE